MGGQSIWAAISKGHNGLFQTKSVQYWRRYLGNPWYLANIDIDVSTHPRDRRDIAIAVLQDALGKRAVGSIWGAFVHRIVVTLPSFYSKENDPSWNHPHTMLCVVCVVQRIVLTSPSSYSKEKDPWKHPHTQLYVVCFVHRIVLNLPSSHSNEKDPSCKHPHTLLCVDHVVHRKVLTSPSSHSNEKYPSWKHPRTLPCVVHVVHRVVLYLPSSHSREKDPSWKHPHILLCVVHVLLWFTLIVFCKFLHFNHINLPKRCFNWIFLVQFLF